MVDLVRKADQKTDVEPKSDWDSFKTLTGMGGTEEVFLQKLRREAEIRGREMPRVCLSPDGLPIMVMFVENQAVVEVLGREQDIKSTEHLYLIGFDAREVGWDRKPNEVDEAVIGLFLLRWMDWILKNFWDGETWLR